MATERTNSGARLLPLSERMTHNQLVKRSEKLAYRQQISLEHARTRGLALSGYFLREANILQRVWWMLTGRLHGQGRA